LFNNFTNISSMNYNDDIEVTTTHGFEVVGDTVVDKQNDDEITSLHKNNHQNQLKQSFLSLKHKQNGNKSGSFNDLKMKFKLKGQRCFDFSSFRKNAQIFKNCLFNIDNNNNQNESSNTNEDDDDDGFKESSFNYYINKSKSSVPLNNNNNKSVSVQQLINKVILNDHNYNDRIQEFKNLNNRRFKSMSLCQTLGTSFLISDISPAPLAKPESFSDITSSESSFSFFLI
jgi:hypothetical protein